MIPSFSKLYSATKIQFQSRLLALDPGETTGYCVFEKDQLVEAGQLITKTVEEGGLVLNREIDRIRPDFMVCESYRVYAHKTDVHTNSDLMTSRLIGAIELLCTIKGIKLSQQSAQIAKGFTTDFKLKEWKWWKKGERHARDSIRHAVYFILFTYPKIAKEKK